MFKIPKIDPLHFDWITWRSGSIKDFKVPSRYRFIIQYKHIFQEYAIGYCRGESLVCRPKRDHTAVMFHKDDRNFWFHLRNNEFEEVFKDLYEK